MSRRRLPSLADLPHQLRERMNALPGEWRAWRNNLRENPAAFWESPLVRVMGLPLLVIVCATGLAWLVEGLRPGSGQAFQEATTRATLHVACTNPDCRVHYIAREEMTFDAWPLTCKECGQPTVYRSRTCPTCGHRFATAPGEPDRCPFCAEKEAARRSAETPGRRTHSGDDLEDPW